MYSILYHRFFSAASFKTFFFSCLEEAGLKSGNLVQFPQQLQVFCFFWTNSFVFVLRVSLCTTVLSRQVISDCADIIITSSVKPFPLSVVELNDKIQKSVWNRTKYRAEESLKGIFLLWCFKSTPVAKYVKKKPSQNLLILFKNNITYV